VKAINVAFNVVDKFRGGKFTTDFLFILLECLKKIISSLINVNVVKVAFGLLRVYFGFTSGLLRVYFGFTSGLLRVYFGFTPQSLSSDSKHLAVMT